MAALKIPRFPFSHTSRNLSFFNYSSWYSPPSPYHDDPLLKTISEAIKTSATTSNTSSLKNILPSLTPSHLINLINHNPHSLSPNSLFSFFNFLSSQPHSRLTLQSYCAMIHFLIARKMLSQAQRLLHLVVSKQGKGSSSKLFASVLETRGSLESIIIVFLLMGVAVCLIE
ncbi:hypothetical protein Pint_18532 [Pistacia integerrima]|uniref:Uncharacterized protein n=1 Tax=Pistacia integerrima TaxID=434235 RepID=A0ACC0YZR8_9ROSI|nr:hypothetical protein Pint_18532 [Pistacia integerrima]